MVSQLQYVLVPYIYTFGDYHADNHLVTTQGCFAELACSLYSRGGNLKSYLNSLYSK